LCTVLRQCHEQQHIGDSVEEGDSEGVSVEEEVSVVRSGVVVASVQVATAEATPAWSKS
jgi:hypothetical protein